MEQNHPDGGMGGGNDNHGGGPPALPPVPAAGAPHVPAPMGPAAAHFMAVVDGHHGNAHNDNGQAQPVAAAAAANHDNANVDNANGNNANGDANGNNANHNGNNNMTAEEAAVAAVIAAYESAPDPPQTAEEERLSALRRRHYRNRETLATVLSRINDGRWEDLRRILEESDAEDRNQIFGADNLGRYVAPLPFTVEMNRRSGRTRRGDAGTDNGGGGDDGDDQDDAIGAGERTNGNINHHHHSHEPNAAVMAAATTASRTHAIDANVFQACCMSGRDVPVDILGQIAAIDGGRALTTATKPPVSYRQRHRPYHGGGGMGGPNRYMHGEMIRRDPFAIACVNGHERVLKFILDEVGGGNGSGQNGTKNPTTTTTTTPQQRSKVRALASGEDPGFDISLLDACFVRQLMPHAFTGMTSGATQHGGGAANPDANLEFIRYHLQDVLTSLRLMNAEHGMSAPLANTWSKAKIIMDALFCNPANGRPFPSLVLHKLFSRDYNSNILSVIPWLILKLYPDQAKAVDVNGNLPLHCFCKNNAGRKLYQFEMTPGTEYLLTNEAREMLQSIAPNNILSTIIGFYPEAALKKNRRGRLPLHEASDNKWFDYEEIERLAKADPEALDVPDPVTGLYPFMMAASHPPVHKTGHDDVTKIFILLRESPENARRFVKETSEGTKVKSLKVAKPSERVANGNHASVTKQGNRKRSSSSKKRFVDDDFLSGSSEDEDYNIRQPMKRSSSGGGIEGGSKNSTCSSSKKKSSAASEANSSSGPRSSIKSKKSTRRNSASQNGGKKYTSLSWNDGSDSDDLMDDRDELF